MARKGLIHEGSTDAWRSWKVARLARGDGTCSDTDERKRPGSTPTVRRGVDDGVRDSRLEADMGPVWRNNRELF